MAQYQIRDAFFGLALIEADSAREALCLFHAERVHAQIRPLVVADGDEAEVTVDGQTLWAVPLPKPG